MDITLSPGSTPRRSRVIITHPSRNVTVVEVPPASWIAVFVPAAFSTLILGAFFWFSGLSIRHSSRVEKTFICVTVAIFELGPLIGGLAARRSTTLTADRRSLRRVAIGLFGRRDAEWFASQIDRLEVRASKGTDDNGRPNAHYLMAIFVDKTETKLLTNLQAPELENARNELAATLDRQGPTAAFVATAASPSRPMPAGMRWLFFLAFTIGPAIAAAFAFRSAIRQDYYLTHGMPMTATILDRALVTDTDNDGGSTTQAKIHYRYTVNDHDYVSSDLFPNGVTGSTERRDGEALYEKTRVGQQLPGWYVSDRPERAYLIRRRSSTDQETMLFLDLFITVGLGIKMWPKQTGVANALPMRPRLILFGVWFVIGAAAIGQYLLGGPVTWTTEWTIFVTAWTAISVGLLVGVFVIGRRSSATVLQ